MSQGFRADIRLLWLSLLKAPGSLWLVYGIVYVSVGFVNHRLGQALRIAEFSHDWQVLTCYGAYLVPWSIATRRLALFDQYRWGLLALALLELPGYALQTSIAHPNNMIDRVVGERNFSLVMTIAFAWILPLGNLTCGLLHRTLRVARHQSTGIGARLSPGYVRANRIEPSARRRKSARS